MQKQALIEATAIKEGIKQQLPGALFGEQAERTGQFGEAERGAELPEEQEATDAEQGRQQSFARLFPPQGQAGGGPIAATGGGVSAGCHRDRSWS